MTQRKMPEIVFENGKPVKVILDYKMYRCMLEDLEDLEDIRCLEKIRKRPQGSIPLSEYLAKRKIGIKKGVRRK